MLVLQLFKLILGDFGPAGSNKSYPVPDVRGKTVEEAKAIKPELLKAYGEKLVLTRGRVSAEYRKTVCMNLLGDFLAEKGI